MRCSHYFQIRLDCLVYHGLRQNLIKEQIFNDSSFFALCFSHSKANMTSNNVLSVCALNPSCILILASRCLAFLSVTLGDRQEVVKLIVTENSRSQ
jgi:hypothetical protein